MEKLTIGIIRDWASNTVGWWTTKQLDEDLEVGSSDGKNVRRVSLHRMCLDVEIEKHPHQEGKYRYIRKDYHKLDPRADPKNVLDIHWPYAREDGTSFGLSAVKIYPKSVIVISGVSNACKTGFCLNFLIENMDYHHCVYMTNELSDEEFVDRLSNFDWAELKNGNGEWKFDAWEHFENYHDILQPDAINIIDYLDPGENSFLIGVLIDQIRQKLNKGIAVIAIQKGISSYVDREGKKRYSYREYGTGGQYSEHRARLVLHFDPSEDNRFIMLVKKSKVFSLTGRRFKFNIINNGSKFHHIEEMED